MICQHKIIFFQRFCLSPTRYGAEADGEEGNRPKRTKYSKQRDKKRQNTQNMQRDKKRRNIQNMQSDILKVQETKEDGKKYKRQNLQKIVKVRRQTKQACKAW